MRARDSLRIEEPCHADWGAMAGDARRRRCGECRLDVYNFSEMTQREVDRVLERAKKRAAKHADARLCVRYVQREDGSIVTKHCVTEFRANLLRALRWTSAMVAALISFVPGVPREAKGALLGTATVQTTGRAALSAALVQAASGRTSSSTALVQIQSAAKPGVIEVVDPSGAVIPGVAVHFTNEKTGEVTTGETDKDGAVRIDAVPAATYKIAMGYPGFVTKTVEHVALPLSAAMRIELQVASTMGVVMVTSTANPEPATGTLSRKLEEPKQGASERAAAQTPVQKPAADSVVVVTGQNGKAMAFFQIRVLNNETGKAIWFSTDKYGIARIHGLPSGEYRIEFEQGMALEDLSHVTFPSATAIRATYQHSAEMGAITWGPTHYKNTGKPSESIDKPADAQVKMALRHEAEQRVAPEIDPNAELETPLGTASLALSVKGFGGQPVGVTVVVTNDETHAEATGTPDANGQIRFVGLAEGMYTISVSATNRGTTVLHRRLPSMLPVSTYLPGPVDPNGKPEMGAVGSRR